MKYPIRLPGMTHPATRLLILLAVSHASISFAGTPRQWNGPDYPQPHYGQGPSSSQAKGQALTSAGGGDYPSWLSACVAHDMAVDGSNDPDHAETARLNCESDWKARQGRARIQAPTPIIVLQPQPTPLRARSRWRTCDIYTPPTRAHRSEYIPCPPQKRKLVTPVVLVPLPPGSTAIGKGNPHDFPSAPMPERLQAPDLGWIKGGKALPPPTPLDPGPTRYSIPGQVSGDEAQDATPSDQFKGFLPLQDSIVKSEPLPPLPPSQLAAAPELGEADLLGYYPDGYRFFVEGPGGISPDSARLSAARRRFSRIVERTQPAGCHTVFPATRIIFVEPGARMPAGGSRLAGFSYLGSALYVRDNPSSMRDAVTSADTQCDRSATNGVTEGAGLARLPDLPAATAPLAADPANTGAGSLNEPLPLY